MAFDHVLATIKTDVRYLPPYRDPASLIDEKIDGSLEEGGSLARACTDICELT